MGDLLSRQGDSQAALDAYQTAIKQSGGVYPEAYYHMGQAHVRSRNTEAAAEAYRKAIEQRGGYYPEAHQDLGRALYSIGNLEAANEEYSIAVRQRSPQQSGPGNGAEQNAKTATSESKRARRKAIAGELETALRQAPAATDAGKSAATATLASDLLPDESDNARTSPLKAEGD